jgi:anti-sigma factor RsiW
MADSNELTCQELVELVTDYLEGSLPSGERARFAAHLADCDYCIGYIEQMRLTIRALGRLSEDHIAPDARERLLAQFRDWKRASGVAPAP